MQRWIFNSSTDQAELVEGIKRPFSLYRWIFNSSTDQAELVEGVKRPLSLYRNEGHYFQLDRDQSHINYESTYDTERECLEERAERSEQAAEEYQAYVESAKADRDNHLNLARKLRKRIEALS